MRHDSNEHVGGCFAVVGTIMVLFVILLFAAALWGFGEGMRHTSEVMTWLL